MYMCMCVCLCTRVLYGYCVSLHDDDVQIYKEFLSLHIKYIVYSVNINTYINRSAHVVFAHIYSSANHSSLRRIIKTVGPKN